MRRSTLSWVIASVMTFLVIGTASAQQQPQTLDMAAVAPVSNTDTLVDVSPRRPGGRARAQGNPFEHVSSESLLATLERLTTIGAHRGWRQSTTAGEDQAMTLVEDELSGMEFLRRRGMHSWRQPFRTFTGVEFWETSVSLVRGGSTTVVEADGAPGHRDWLDLAFRIDSDGELNDRRRDPLVVTGNPLVVRTADQIYGLSPGQVAGRVVFLDYAVIDRSIMNTSEAVGRAWVLLEKGPAGVVMVTRHSNQIGDSHGAFAGDFPAFTWVEIGYDVPVLSVKMEALEDAGILSWADLESLDNVHVTWDVDLFAPGDSQYLAARIPGWDATRAVILGAHIDSSNTPGAFDDGSGSAALLEVARALDRAWTIPEVDVVLAWFGSHERGLYGSYNFTAHSSELLDRTMAMLQMDCLGHPLDGITNEIWIETWSYEAHGDGSIPWPEYLHGLAADRGISTRLADLHYLVSDNSSFSGYGIANANMIFMNPFAAVEVHYGNHLHDPYDDMPLARLEGEAFEDMAAIMLAAAIHTGADDPWVRVPPEPDRRALFIGSHTEGIHMSPAGLTEFGMSLTWDGFDVDMVPYGREVTPAELAASDLVVVLPVHDYPTQGGDLGLYDEDWTAAEVNALEDWVGDGGVLVLTTSAHRLKYLNRPYDPNEDRLDINQVALRFGLSYQASVLPGNLAMTTGDHQLVQGVSLIRMVGDNGLALDAGTGQVVAHVGGDPAVVVLPYGSGRIVALSDLGMLGATQDPPVNLRFWRNLAEYAR